MTANRRDPALRGSRTSVASIDGTGDRVGADAARVEVSEATSPPAQEAADAAASRRTRPRPIMSI